MNLEELRVVSAQIASLRAFVGDSGYLTILTVSYLVTFVSLEILSRSDSKDSYSGYLMYQKEALSFLSQPSFLTIAYLQLSVPQKSYLALRRNQNRFIHVELSLA